MLDIIEAGAVNAMRPFGYYAAQATATLRQQDDGSWRTEIAVQPGPPIVIDALLLEISGEGAGSPDLRAWETRWPLHRGEVLNQVAWDAQLAQLRDLLEADGYFNATFVQQRIELYASELRADLFLEVQTGPRSVFGEVVFDQDFLAPYVLAPVPRFRSGEPYAQWQVDQLRTDLWKLGFFGAVNVSEERSSGASPPTVDLRVEVTPGKRNTHQGTLGYGTDTEWRAQYRWQRHLLSERGDSLSLGTSWQKRTRKLLITGEYRLPRRARRQEYWLFSPTLAQEDQLFELDIDGQDEKLPVAEGRLDEAFARLGRVRLRNPRDSREQLIETVFLQFVSEDNEFAELSDLDRSTLRNSTPLIPGGRVNSLALGIEWDLPVLTGRGFDLSGHRQRASLFTSSSRWGSDVSYSQIYLSSRWNLRLNDDWRLLLRGEAAYSDAEVRELTFEREGLQVEVSLTELPVRYRFKAGGGFSVRGYGYESLSNNGLGSNHLLTGSVELERRLVGDWSVSTFFDTGNAFNDWSQPGLRKGAGLGVRWYALGFPLRLDVASALDLPGNPWRLHLTLGTTLF